MKIFAAAQGEKKYAGIGKLIEHSLDLGRGHLAVVVVVKIAVHAAFVAAIGDIEMNGDGDAKVEGFLTGFDHQAHAEAWGAKGRSETSRMP